MKGRFVLLVLCFWACAERDNPYDPANRPTGQVVDTGPRLPVPGPGIKVVLRDSASRANSQLPYHYFANIQSAFDTLDPGDTLWVQGGRTYSTMSLTLRRGGARLLPVTIRSFGGEARILARSLVPNLLVLEQGAVFVHISGFAFVGATAPAILGVNIPGDIWIDSCRIDTSYTAIEMRNIAGSVRIHDVTMTADSLVPPVSFQGVGLLDTARLRW